MKKSFILLLPVASFLLINNTIIDSDAELKRLQQERETESQLLGHGYDFNRNGKIKSEKAFSSVYTEDLFVNAENAIPNISSQLLPTLERQRSLLKRRKQQKVHQIGDLTVDLDDISKTIDIIEESILTGDLNIADKLKAYQIAGEDNEGNVHFTGYFTPVLKVSKKKTKVYKYPLYTVPNKEDFGGRFPSREEIDGHKVLDGQNLELAYAKNLVDIYFMQVQGSGIVEYRDGTKELYAFKGSNGHKYRSIGRYMVNQGLTTAERVSLKSIRNYFLRNPDQMEEVLFQNPSYVFFKPMKAKPTGAGHVPLTADYSIAVDPKFIPLGSVLLAAVPILDEKNNFSHHEYRVLVAQDIGGAIKGKGHVDLYTGIGEVGQKKASALHHYGGLWLLMPKSEEITP